MTAPSVRLALVAGLGVSALIASCGGMSKRPAQAPPTDAPVTWPTTPEAARARIETLDREIAARNETLDARPAVTSHDPATSPMIEPGGDTETCVRSARPVCQDVCSLSDSICDAADEICKLAADLPGDDWAAGRCTAGKESCDKARLRCCNC